jgi:hypothetical protein
MMMHFTVVLLQGGGLPELGFGGVASHGLRHATGKPQSVGTVGAGSGTRTPACGGTTSLYGEPSHIIAH